MIIAKSIAARAVVCLVSLAVVLSTVLLWRERRVHADSTRVRYCIYDAHGFQVTKYATVEVPGFDPVFDLRHVQTIGLSDTSSDRDSRTWGQMLTHAVSYEGGAVVYVPCGGVTEVRFTFNDGD